MTIKKTKVFFYKSYILPNIISRFKYLGFRKQKFCNNIMSNSLKISIKIYIKNNVKL